LVVYFDAFDARLFEQFVGGDEVHGPQLPSQRQSGVVHHISIGNNHLALEASLETARGVAMSRTAVDLAEVRLRESDETLALVEVVYKRDVYSQVLSDELVYSIRAVASDCQSALDTTAVRVKKKYLKTSDWMSWFPLGRDPADFAKKLDQQLPGLFASESRIAAAFGRHQPYQPGNSELGYLHTLAHANRHSDFSPHRRIETVEIESVPGGGFTVSALEVSLRVREGAAVTTGDSADLDLSGADPVVARYMTRTVLVGWNFLDPPEPVLPTLRALVRQTRDAVADICREAGL
jgi:hypothetical protein